MCWGSRVGLFVVLLNGDGIRVLGFFVFNLFFFYFD